MVGKSPKDRVVGPLPKHVSESWEPILQVPYLPRMAIGGKFQGFTYYKLSYPGGDEPASWLG